MDASTGGPASYVSCGCMKGSKAASFHCNKCWTAVQQQDGCIPEGTAYATGCTHILCVRILLIAYTSVLQGEWHAARQMQGSSLHGRLHSSIMSEAPAPPARVPPVAPSPCTRVRPAQRDALVYRNGPMVHDLLVEICPWYAGNLCGIGGRAWGLRGMWKRHGRSVLPASLNQSGPG